MEPPITDMVPGTVVSPKIDDGVTSPTKFTPGSNRNTVPNVTACPDSGVGVACAGVLPGKPDTWKVVGVAADTTPVVLNRRLLVNPDSSMICPSVTAACPVALALLYWNCAMPPANICDDVML